MMVEEISKRNEKTIIRKQLGNRNTIVASKIVDCTFKSANYIIPNVNKLLSVQLQYMLF